jgi:hypothetical protein
VPVRSEGRTRRLAGRCSGCSLSSLSPCSKIPPMRSPRGCSSETYAAAPAPAAAAAAGSISTQQPDPIWRAGGRDAAMTVVVFSAGCLNGSCNDAHDAQVQQATTKTSPGSAPCHRTRGREMAIVIRGSPANLGVLRAPSTVRGDVVRDAAPARCLLVLRGVSVPRRRVEVGAVQQGARRRLPCRLVPHNDAEEGAEKCEAQRAKLALLVLFVVVVAVVVISRFIIVVNSSSNSSPSAVLFLKVLATAGTGGRRLCRLVTCGDPVLAVAAQGRRAAVPLAGCCFAHRRWRLPPPVGCCRRLAAGRVLERTRTTTMYL